MGANHFTDLLFSWSLTEIFDQNLYKHQVEKIPDCFESVAQYLGSFIYPLLEETHTELAYALETAYKAPFAVVTEFKQSKNGKLVYDVKVDCGRNRVRDRDGAPYRTLPGDVLLISDKKPENDSDIHRVDLMYCLASVKKIVCDEDGGGIVSTRFTVKTAIEIDTESLESTSIYVVFLANIASNKRIWRALHMCRNLKVIERVLRKDDLVEENCDLCPYISYSDMEKKLGSKLLSKLNESQKDAILSALCKIECDHNSSVELIWGPPGTGKTATLSVLLFALLKMGVNTLICAPTNVAITELASRVVKLVRNSVEDEFWECFLTSPLGGMLIFGNLDRLQIGSDIEDIFLDHRVSMLANCVLPTGGWRQSVMSTIDFLDNVVSLHEVYVENELQIKEKEGISDGFPSSHPKSLLKFARERFAQLKTNLRRSMCTLLTHLPRSYIHEGNVQRIMHLMSLLNSIENLLEDGSMTSEGLKNILLQKEMSGSEDLVHKSSLAKIISQCVSILRSLQASLTHLVDNKISTEKFCFQRAQLIFCTISSSSKLYSIDMKPFKSLVIDEAGQVKECESTIALQIPEVRHVVLVGDECQLTATVTSPVAENAGFGRSLFERLSSLGHYKNLLNMQYRMHPSISCFPNANFYHNQILDAPFVQSESYEINYLEGLMFGPYSFIDIREGKEEMDDVGRSRRNLVEAAIAVKLVEKVFKAYNSRSPEEKISIGVISPYAAQVLAIRDKLHPKFANNDEFVVKVKSIDGFQGGEEDIIIISTVRSNRSGSIGFLSSPKRTNVALTRARHCLWILGNESTLCERDSVWEALVKDAKFRQCFFTADDDCDLKKVVIDVKKELDELDDMLSPDSMLFKYSRWKVLFSDNFRISFNKLNSSSVKKLALHLLLKLANGWRPRKINVDWKCPISSHIVKQFKFNEYYIISTIDLIKESAYKQVLKVWDILHMGEAPKLLKRLDSIFAKFTDDFINHCQEKLFEGALEVPMSWPVSKEIIRYKNQNAITSSSGMCSADDCISYLENSKVNESLLLMKFYSLSTGTVNHLLSDLEGREVDFPFEVTDEERQIIVFPRSSFILGRSGTGKTTVLTMKLIQKLQQYCIASYDTNKDKSQESMLRQLFVTVSPKLCHAVRKHVSRLKRFAIGSFIDDDSSTDMDDVDVEFKDIPDTFVGIKPEKYPLIITLNKFLMMLDGTFGSSYFQRFRDVRCSIQKEGIRSVALETFMRNKEVTFERFQSTYWPHFNSNLTRNLDPSRVYTEIMSHIKGGLQEGEESNSRRSRPTYISLSDSRVSTLSVETRNVIYDIFVDYERMKMKRGEFDFADFVLDVHQRVKDGNLPRDKMDFVYIDEVQDFTMRQICLFRHICKNVDEGFVFSGDTAQTIARGIDFRFQDIRSLFYNEFVMKSRNSQPFGRREKGVISDIISLSQNFRTHIGVLRSAQSVTDLISYFFPQSIDVLPPETSLIYGEPPIFLEPGSDENSIISIFRNSASAGEKWVGFGAEQVILVRDDSEKRAISKYIGQQALILTIVECKGLEFQDVLLYNFFGSSPIHHEWRVVYEFLTKKELPDANTPQSFPVFSMSRHNILCSELKQLYVVITRTRQRLWICENNEEISKPMLDYWKSLHLVQIRRLDDSLSEAMKKASSPEEWKAQGLKLFWEKNYEMATMCFEKAGEESWEKQAKASGLRAASYSLRDSNPLESRIMLLQAAEIFDSIGRSDCAAECFCDLGDFKRAGRIYLEKCGKSELRKAGECFCLAGIYETAAEVYAKENFFDECLAACSRGNLFELGLQYINSWKLDLPLKSLNMERDGWINRIAQDFLEKCALKYHARQDKAMLMKFVRAFHTMESRHNFLKSKGYLKEILLLEEESGNYNEAAEIAMYLGDIQCEVDLLDKAGWFKKASSLILSYVLSNSLWESEAQHLSFSQKSELLDKAMKIAQKVSDAFHTSICAEARVLSGEQKNLSELMQCYMSSKQFDTHVGESLCIQKLLDVHCKLLPTNFEWETEVHIHPSSLDERFLRNQASIATLFHVWNLWKERSLEILECLDTLEKMDIIEYEGVVRFCLNYFGLRLEEKYNGKFILLNPKVSWFKNIDKRFVKRTGKLVILDACHFGPAARKHWQQEFLSVGFVVLEALKSLYVHSQHKHSKDLQSLLLTYIYDIAKFFLVSKSIDVKKRADAWKLQDFVKLSTGHFENAFPLDPRDSLSEKMMYLRETQLSRNLLGETISMNISNSRNDLTYGQIGRVAMILLGSGIPKQDVCAVISKRFSESTSSWKLFIENLLRIIGLSVKEGSGAVDSLSYELYKAIEETYNVNWNARDFMSPHCFFYLVERLLILLPHSGGFFFATKSSFAEYLISLDSDANPCSMLCTKESPHTVSVVSFICELVQHYLKNPGSMADWIKASWINCKYYFRVLLLRLLMILCLLCLNSDISFSMLTRLLSAYRIRSQLPRQFCDAICSERTTQKPSVATAVATAFKVVNDPLMVVSITESSPTSLCHRDAISVDLRFFASRDESLRNLFPRSINTSSSDHVASSAAHPQPQTPAGSSNQAVTAVQSYSHMEDKLINSETKKEDLHVNWGLIREVWDEIETPVGGSNESVTAVQSYSHTGDMAFNSETQNDDLQDNLGLIREVWDDLETLLDRNNEDLKDLIPGKKVELEEHLQSLTALLIKQRPCHGDDGSAVQEATSMIGEVVQQLDTMDADADHLKAALLEIGRVLSKMEIKHPEIDSVNGLWASHDNATYEASSKSITNDDEKGDDDSAAGEDEDEDEYDDDASAAGAQCKERYGNNNMRSSSKNKKKNKRKKGRKGGRKRLCICSSLQFET